MSDVVIQSLAGNVFWLVIVLAVMATFRTELRNLLNSLGSFKLAGASFELKDSRSTLESYVVLTNIMIETLSQRDSALKLGDALSDLSVRQLARFAITYAKNVPKDFKEVELLKNVATIITRRGDTDSAKLFYDALLKVDPKDVDVLNLKANALMDGHHSDLLEAEKIQDALVTRRPKAANVRFNRALTKAKLGKNTEAIADLDVALDLGYWRRKADMLSPKEFDPLREDQDFRELLLKLGRLRNS